MNKHVFVFLFLLVLAVSSTPVSAQQSQLSLYRVVELAKEESPAALQAATIKENFYWQYRTYLSNYKPQLVLDGREEFSREVVPTRQNDGTYAFPQVNQNFGTLALSLEQQIGFTGSRIFLTSSLQRFDNFYTGERQYSGNPAFIGLTQPLFAFNRLRWDRKIEPLRFEESQKKYVQDLEAIAGRATDLFFDLLLAQVSLDIARKNLHNNDTIYKIAEGRYNLGKVSEGELLQLELTLMRARQQVARAQLELQTNALRLKSYIGINSGDSIALIAPAEIPAFGVDEAIALQEASANRQEAIAFRRQQLEAERNLSQARRSGGLNADLTATFGLTNRGQALGDVYNQPDDQQAVMFNFSVPLVDWGRQRSRVKTAEANQQLIEYTVAQERINFEQEIFTQVKLFEMLREQTVIAEKSDDIAQRRYDLSKNRYLIGKISITDLNIAMQEKDEARRSYIASLRDFWTAYYRLRELTLFDFQQNIPILAD